MPFLLLADACVQDAEGKYEVLAKYARDLTEEARAGKLVRAPLSRIYARPGQD